MIFISQPTFLPWIGYFDLIDQSDLFVILDDAKFEKQSWQQRNQFKTQNGFELFSIPVLSNNEGLINEILIFNSKKITNKFVNFLNTNYSKAKYKYFKIEGFICSVIGLPSFKRSKFDKK